MIDNMGTVECEECRDEVRWVGTVKVQGIREQENGELALQPVRVCRDCASRCLLPPTLPGRAIRSDPANWQFLWKQTDTEEN